MKIYKKKCEYNGITFDSKDEVNRYIALKEMEKEGLVSQIHLQVSFILIPKLIKEEIKHLKTKDKVIERVIEQPSVYTCDVVYREGDKIVIEEIKSKYTASFTDYILRRKMMLYKLILHERKRKRKAFIFREVVYYPKGVIKIKDRL